MTEPNEPSATEPVRVRGGLNALSLARGLKLVALLLFLLPWVTVSCADQTLVQMSGLDLATGSVSVRNPITGESVKPPNGGEADLSVLLGALAIAAALLASFLLKGRTAALAGIVGAALGALLISYSVLIRIPAKARQDASAEAVQGMSQAQLMDLIRVDAALGFWLTLGALLGAIALNWTAQRAPPAPPPQP